MPPDPTQNLNARLSPIRPARGKGGTPAVAGRRLGTRASQTKIVSGPPQYRGGYHLNV